MISSASSASFQTVADLLDRLGGIPPERVRLQPTPGTATEQDVIAVLDHENRFCELYDGVLVEKARGFYESRLAMVLGHLLQSFLEVQDLGIVAGADGTIRFAPGLVRISDVSFISWNRLPQKQIPRAPIPDLVPDLAVEVLSAGNTDAEMTRKCQEYFDAGVRLVWYLDPDARTMEVFTAPQKSRIIGEDQRLDGGDVLPGFQLPLSELFAKAGPRQSS